MNITRYKANDSAERFEAHVLEIPDGDGAIELHDDVQGVPWYTTRANERDVWAPGEQIAERCSLAGWRAFCRKNGFMIEYENTPRIFGVAAGLDGEATVVSLAHTRSATPNPANDYVISELEAIREAFNTSLNRLIAAVAEYPDAAA